MFARSGLSAKASVVDDDDGVVMGTVVGVAWLASRELCMACNMADSDTAWNC